MNTKRWIIDSMASWGGALVAAIVITYFRYMDQYVLLWPPERVGMGFVSLHVPEQQPCLVQLRFFYRLMHNLTTYWALIFYVEFFVLAFGLHVRRMRAEKPDKSFAQKCILGHTLFVLLYLFSLFNTSNRDFFERIDPAVSDVHEVERAASNLNRK